MSAFLPGLCTVTFRHLPPAQIVALAAEAGIAGIEWAGDVHVPPGDVDVAQAVRKLTEAAGLNVSSYGSYIAPPTSSLADFDAALASAEALGTSHIRLWPGTRDKASASYSAGERAAVIDSLAAMGRRAAGRGVTLGLEFHPGSLADDTASAIATISALRDANVYLYWQPRPGLPLPEALDEIAQLGPDICHLHVFAWDAARLRYRLADHAAYWRAVLDALPPTRWTGPRYAMLEFVRGDDPGQFRADAACLQLLLQGPSPTP